MIAEPLVLFDARECDPSYVDDVLSAFSAYNLQVIRLEGGAYHQRFLMNAWLDNGDVVGYTASINEYGLTRETIDVNGVRVHTTDVMEANARDDVDHDLFLELYEIIDIYLMYLNVRSHG